MTLAVTLVGLGQGVIFARAVVAAGTVLVKAPPCRWLARTLVSGPALGALRREVTDVVRGEVPAAVEEALAKHPLTNGWGTNAITKIAEATGADVTPPATEHDTSDKEKNP